MAAEIKILKQAKERRRPLGFSLSDYLRSMDWVLLGAALCLVFYGMLMIYSATHADRNISNPFYYVRQQSVGLVLGAVLLFMLSVVNYQRFARYKRYLYGVTLVILVLTLVVGLELKGARRWIHIPGVTDLQTSEIAKLLLIVSFGAFLADAVALRDRFRFVLVAVIYMLIPAGLVFLQPDLGTALVFGSILVTMLVVWGIRLPHLVTLGGATAFIAVVILRLLPSAFGIHVLKDYQLQRLTAFLSPSNDPSGASYQLFQSKIAIGSGVFSGKGFMKGTQTNLNFLPAHHTDFIFSVVGEELGFIGCLLLLALFAVLIWRAYRIARLSRDLYGSMMAAAVAGVLTFQVFVNTGMTLGIMPVTGIPLPLVSYGSSSLVVFLMMVGLLESIHVHSVAGGAK
jgi:rod shape determining protein RodA